MSLSLVYPANVVSGASQIQGKQFASQTGRS